MWKLGLRTIAALARAPHSVNEFLVVRDEDGEREQEAAIRRSCSSEGAGAGGVGREGTERFARVSGWQHACTLAAHHLGGA